MNAQMYFGGEQNAKRKAQRFLDNLERRGLAIKKQFAASVPPPEVHRPLAVVDPTVFAQDRRAADPGVLSNLAIKRFRNTIPGTLTLYTASKVSRRVFGGPELRGGFVGRWDQVDHDLILAAACCLMRKQRPKLFEELRQEHVYRRFYHLRRDKLPDALVCGSTYARPKIVLDSIGRYSAKGIRELITRWIEAPPEGFEPTRLEMY